MVPINVINNKGEVIGQQAWNDNLTVVEQLNRSMLDTLVFAQQKLTNNKNKLDRIVASGNYDAEKLSSLMSAATALNSAVHEAIATFEAAIVAE